MDKTELIYRIQLAYPRIYQTCHTEHQLSTKNGVSISQRDATILAHLNLIDPMSQAQLARHLGITKSTMSEAIKYLMGSDLLEMEVATDKRSHLLRLTNHGRQVMSDSSVLEADKLTAVLAEMNDTEIEQAVAGLELLAQACFGLTTKEKDEK
ncbi:MarR family winged helix-turn-helix transcriptional regulator [Undibacterium sp. Di27W]|uniref:MarR family winged helix-turn-helix transcriptional regulator n=1 Tax=Undibacterium sp. Di27W TaxID=3413036 RepID=UPI003BF2EB21